MLSPKGMCSSPLVLCLCGSWSVTWSQLHPVNTLITVPPSIPSNRWSLTGRHITLSVWMQCWQGLKLTNQIWKVWAKHFFSQPHAIGQLSMTDVWAVLVWNMTAHTASYHNALAAASHWSQESVGCLMIYKVVWPSKASNGTCMHTSPVAEEADYSEPGEYESPEGACLSGHKESRIIRKCHPVHLGKDIETETEKAFQFKIGLFQLCK